MRRLRLLVCVLCACPCLVLAAELDAADPTWRALPDLPRAGGVITGMGVDSGGTLWVMTNTAPEDLSWATRKLFWWDGAKWQEPKSEAEDATKNADELQADFFYCLFGGGTRGLYAVYWSGGRQAKAGDPASVCKLVEGEVQPVAGYAQKSWLDPRVTYNGAFPSAGLHVARDGRLFAYGEGFLEMRLDEGWKLLARPKRPTSVSFVEQGDLLHVAYDGFLCTVSPDGSAVTRRLDGLGDREVSAGGHAVLWGDDKLLVVTTPRTQPLNLYAFEIEAGKPIDIEDITKALEGEVVVGKVVNDAVRVPDGSVWLFDSSGSVRVLSAEGDLFELDELGGVAWDSRRSCWFPSSVLTASDGTLWLAPAWSGLIAYSAKNGTFARYGIEDLGPERINFIAEGKDGTIYAAASHRVYAFSSDRAAAAAQ